MVEKIENFILISLDKIVVKEEIEGVLYVTLLLI